MLEMDFNIKQDVDVLVAVMSLMFRKMNKVRNVVVVLYKAYNVEMPNFKENNMVYGEEVYSYSNI